MEETNENMDQADILIQHLKDGVESAYEVLFKTFYKELVVYANRYLYNMDVSKEVVQDLFVKLYEKRKKLAINSSLKAYLFRSVQNKCINYINAQKIRNKYTETAKNNQVEVDTPIDKSIDLAELENALYAAIGELPPKCRMIFKMNRFEGYSNQEIAERLDLSKRTVETQITKALRALRTKLRPFIQEAMLIGVLIMQIHW